MISPNHRGFSCLRCCPHKTCQQILRDELNSSVPLLIFHIDVHTDGSHGNMTKLDFEFAINWTSLAMLGPPNRDTLDVLESSFVLMSLSNLPDISLAVSQIPSGFIEFTIDIMPFSDCNCQRHSASPPAGFSIVFDSFSHPQDVSSTLCCRKQHFP